MSKKILIIDDEVEVMKVVYYRLKAKGYEVFTAANGRDGVYAAIKQKPDLVILDYRLPDLSAKEVNDKIQAAPETKGVPVIMITASVESIAEKTHECGACDFIAKPIEPEDLYAKMEKYCDLRRA